ncbi:MAG: O-antigen ligase family protein, partial [Flavobacteriales bacterium]|nr:O-antigen ligase family protein [Flavobacteriales bacterium]
MPLFYKDPVFQLLLLLVTPILIILSFKERKTVPKYLVYYLGFYIALSVGQAITFNFFEVKTFVGFALRLTFTFLIIQRVGERFPQYYVRLLYFLSIFGFCLYVPGVLIPGFEQFMINNIGNAVASIQAGDGNLYNVKPNIGIFTFSIHHYSYQSIFPRNSGPFWEPGAYAGFLMLAIIFNTARTTVLWNKENRVFMIALLTTFSTGGYIALGLYLVGYYGIFLRRSKMIMMLPIVMAMFYYIFNSVGFLREKFEEHIVNVETTDLSNQKRTRAVSGLLDLQDVAKYPFFGRGRSLETRYGKFHNTSEIHRNNGTSNFAATFGVIAFLMYFMLL